MDLGAAQSRGQKKHISPAVFPSLSPGSFRQEFRLRQNTRQHYSLRLSTLGIWDLLCENHSWILSFRQVRRIPWTLRGLRSRSPSSVHILLFIPCQGQDQPWLPESLAPAQHRAAPGSWHTDVGDQAGPLGSESRHTQQTTGPSDSGPACDHVHLQRHALPLLRNGRKTGKQWGLGEEKAD